MPCASLMSITSSPAAGLPVVPFFRVPVRVCAEAIAPSKSTRDAATIFTESFKLSLLFYQGLMLQPPAPAGTSPPKCRPPRPRGKISETGSPDREVYPPDVQNSDRAGFRRPRPCAP